MSTRSTIIMAGNSTPIISGPLDTRPKMSSSRSGDLPRKGKEPSNTSTSEHKLKGSRPALRHRSSFGGTFHTPRPASHLHLAGLPSWKPTPNHIGQSSSEHSSDNGKVPSDKHHIPAPPDRRLPNQGWSPQELVSSFLDLRTSARLTAWTFPITILADIFTAASSLGALLGRGLTQLISAVVFILCCPPSAPSKPKSASGFDYQFRRGQNILALLSSIDSDGQEAEEVETMLLGSSSDTKKTQVSNHTTTPLRRSSRLPSLATPSPAPSRSSFATARRASGRGRGRNLQVEWDVSPDSLVRNTARYNLHLNTRAPIKVELQARLALGAIQNFPKLLEHFRYEVQDPEWVRILEDPTMEVSSSGEVVPRVVDYQLYWEGKVQELANALEAAFPCLVTHLTIKNCTVAIVDVMAILRACPALELLDIRGIGQVPSILQYPEQPKSSHLHGLMSLTLSSTIPLDPLLADIRFPHLNYTSIRLFNSGNDTPFYHLSKLLGSDLQAFRFRGNLPPATISKIRERCEELGEVDLDIGHMCHSTQPRRRPHWF